MSTKQPVRRIVSLGCPVRGSPVETVRIALGSLLLAVVFPALSPLAEAAVYHVAQGHRAASDDGPGTAEQPWQTVGKAAQVAEAGDRVVVHAGTYREYVEPRNSGRPGAPIVYEGAEGEEVVLTGADVITGWERVPGDRPIFKVAWPHKFIINHVDGKPIYHHPADDNHLRSGRAEQIIVDGEVWDSPQLVLSLDEMQPGTFFPDVESDTLYVWLADGSGPDEHQIEGSTRGLIFGTNPWRRKEGFDYVYVRGFTFRYAATFAQRPAVWLLGKGNLVEDCVVEWMSGGGVGVGPQDGVLRRCVIRNCGHVGGCAGGRNFLNEDCVWEGNCRKPISRGWDAGGVKIARAHHGLFQRCIFRNNGGPGLWLDIDVADVVIRNCLFDGNENHGLFIEISRDIYVMNNAFFRNGLRAEGHKWSIAGLTIAESRHCVVTHNLLVENLDGIALREQGPRYLDTPDLGEVPFVNVGHVITGNVSALNQGYQLGLWYDSAFFGRHPGDKEKYATEEAFEEAIRREKPDLWFDPLQQGLTIARNLYWADQEQKLFLYGVPWRVRYQEFADIQALSEATGFESQGRVEEPGLQDLGDGLWLLSEDSDLFKQGLGPRQPIAGFPQQDATTE